jgi:hypothetical protein
MAETLFYSDGQFSGNHIVLNLQEIFFKSANPKFEMIRVSCRHFEVNTCMSPYPHPESVHFAPYRYITLTLQNSFVNKKNI